MALAISVKINGIDIRSEYGVEILGKQGMGAPAIAGNLTTYANKTGAFRGSSNYQPRGIKLTGEIKANYHDQLIVNIASFKELLYQGSNGKRKIIVEFGDEDDRYYECSTAGPEIILAAPVLTTTFATIELNLTIDSAFSNINDFVLEQIPGSPISGAYSASLNYDGSGESRPRIVCENIGVTNITELKILSMCSREFKKSISVTTTGLKRGAGAFGDSKGAAWFDNAGSSYFPCYGNFNSDCFTVMGFVKLESGQTNPGYLFSTTGDVVRCYYDTGGSRWVFAIDGYSCYINDSTSGFAPNTWWWICCQYDNNMMKLSMAVAGSYDTYYKYGMLPCAGHKSTPVNFYIGTNASLASPGHKFLDELRIYAYHIQSVQSTNEKRYCDTGFPIPMDEGLTAYFPFDYKADGVGWQNNEIILTNTLSQNELVEIDCERMIAYELGAAITANPSNIMSSVSGEFPLLVPLHGYCPIQIAHNGAASGLRVSIEKKERYL